MTDTTMNTHPSNLLPLEREGAGLILTPCPGTKGVPTGVALEQLKAAGAGAVITLMPEREMGSNEVSNLAELCAAAGLQWFHLPVADDHPPEADFAAAWQAQRSAVHRLLDSGGKIAIHCKGGSGRTGLMAAQILVERGRSKDEAKAGGKGPRPAGPRRGVHQGYLSALAETGQPDRS